MADCQLTCECNAFGSIDLDFGDGTTVSNNFLAAKIAELTGRKKSVYETRKAQKKRNKIRYRFVKKQNKVLFL